MNIFKFVIFIFHFFISTIIDLKFKVPQNL